MHAGMDVHSFQDDASSLVKRELLDQLVDDGIGNHLMHGNIDKHNFHHDDCLNVKGELHK